MIVERIDNLKEDVKTRFDQIDEHLRKLNSQTEKNTKFRVGAMAVIKVFSGLGIGGLAVFIIKLALFR